MNTFRLFVKRFWTIALGLAVLELLGARQALAGAVGTELVPAFTVTVGSGVSAPIPVPSGQLTHAIKGRGRRIDSESAFYSISPGLGGLKGQVCNWQIDFSYKENGKEYARERGKTIYECGGLAKRVVGQAKPKTVRLGQACAELWINGKFEAAQCHNIL